MQNLMIFMLVMSAFVSSCSQSTSTLYSRKECIIRMNIDWQKYGGDREIMLERITRSARTARDMGFNKIPAGSSIQGDERQYIYYQFKFDCENRINNGKKLILEIEKSIGIKNLITVDPRSFEPSANTIRNTGKWWKDGKDMFEDTINVDGKNYIRVDP